jgi:hypothetical protein
MTLIGSPDPVTAGRSTDTLTDLHAGDGDAAAPTVAGHAAAALPDYDRSDVASADAAEPVNTPDMPVIAAPPGDPTRPVATAQQGSAHQKAPIDLDSDPVTGAPLAVAILGGDAAAIQRADPAAVSAAAVAQASAELSIGTAVI